MLRLLPLLLLLSVAAALPLGTESSVWGVDVSPASAGGGTDIKVTRNLPVRAAVDTEVQSQPGEVFPDDLSEGSAVGACDVGTMPISIDSPPVAEEPYHIRGITSPLAARVATKSTSANRRIKIPAGINLRDARPTDYISNNGCPDFYDYSMQIVKRTVDPMWKQLELYRWTEGKNYCAHDMGCCFVLKFKI
ncbi:hypothetical protein K440DRAFT_679168 [Wilcoxina mikolae CBS 423.85]|nr:hypothetical protein K440DRAFT_679168 [Wilcoxina mikolae CBS 423.85]